MNSLEYRKQLLIAESELNRAQMAGDLGALVAGVRTISERVKTLSSIASSAGGLVAGLAGFRRKPVDAAHKPSLVRTLLRGAGMASTLWMAFRSAGREQE